MAELKGVWELTETKTGKTASYKVGGKEMIKLTNLSPDLVETDGIVDGLEVTEDSSGNKVTLSASALNGATVAFTSTTYALELDDDVPTVGFDDIEKTVTNGTATFKGTVTAGYTLATNGKSLTYSAAKENQTLATVTGLNTDAGDDDVVLDEDEGTITLSPDALNAKTATLTLKVKNVVDYNLAIDGEVDKITTTPGDWTFASGKATLKGTVDTPGYAVSADGKKVNYIKATTSAGTLATVSGLGAEFESDAVTTDVDETGNYVITLPSESLNQKAVSISGNGYVLALGDDVTTSENAPTHDEWSVSGTTATYKQILPAHYDLSAGKVTYTANATTLQTYATVTNLKSGLTVSEDKQSLLSGSTEVVTIEDNVITVNADALNKKTVALTGTFCTLKSEGTTAPAVDPTTTPAWTVSKTTATYKGKTTEGYSDTDDWTITYVAAKSGATLATVDNLASGLKAADLSNDTSEYYIEVDNAAGTITLPAAVLDAKTITVTPGDGFKYTLELDNESGVATSPETGHSWEVNGTTAKLYKGTSAYYTGTGTTTIEYVPAVQGSSVATLQNLKDGITATDLPTITEEDYSSKTKKYSIALTSAALTNKTVTLTGTSYMLTIDPDEDLSAKSGKTIWKLDDVKGSTPTATLSNYTTEGWKANDKGTQIVYSAPVTGATIATLEGFKSGLQLNEDSTAFTSGITVYTEETVENEGTDDERTYHANTIGIEKAAVGSSAIKLTSSSYKLVVGKDLDESEAERKWTTDNKGAAVYTYSTPAGYSISSDDKTFTATKKTTVTATITGLKATPADTTALAPDDENKIITLSSSNLDGKDVTIKGAYKLAIDSSVKGPELGEPTWDLSTKGKAFLKGTYTKEGYTQTSDTTITHTAADDSTQKTLATVSGLTNPKDTSAVGIENDGSAGIEVTDGKIILSSNLLGTSKVTLGKNDPYTLALNEDDEDLPLEAEEKTEWVVSGTTANYQTYTKGYYAMETKKDGTETGAIIYNKDGKATTLATVKGLAKGATIDNSEGGDYDDETQTLTLNADQLGTTNITLTGSGYSLKLGSDVQQSGDEVTEWVNSGTKATYQTYKQAYYTQSGNTITYNKPGKATVHLTLNGVADEVTDANLNTSKRTITLNADQLNHKSNKATTKLTISKEEAYQGYKIVLADGTSEPDSDEATWAVDGKGKANYVQPVPENTFVNDGTTVTYYNADTSLTLATLSGLNKEITDDDFAGVKVKDGVITLTGGVLQTSNGNNSTKVTVSKGHTLDFASSVATPDTGDPDWNFEDLEKKGSVTYISSLTEGYKLDDKKTTITYSAAKPTDTLFTLSGLNKTSGYDNATDAGFSVDDEGVITLSNADALTSKVSVKGTGYTVAVSSDLAPKTIEDYTEGIWSLKGTTATLSLGTSAGYVQDKNKTSVSLGKATVGDTVATLSGLGKNIKVDNGQLGTLVNKVFTQGVFIRSTGAIALTPDVLGTTDVVLTNAGDNDLTISNENFTEPEYGERIWIYDESKGTATLYETTTEGWTLKDDDTRLEYTANKDNAVLTTISGLSKTFNSDINDAVNTPENKDDTLTITDKTLLGTSKVTIKNATGYTYALALGGNVPEAAEQVTNWLTSGAKATLKTYNTAFYTLDKGAIVYNKPVDEKGKVYAEVSGIAKDVDINDCVNENTHAITLGASQLGTSTVTLTNKTVDSETSDYTLVLGNDATKATTATTATWVTSGTTANLQTTVSAGFTQTSDAKLTYTKDQPKAIIAVIKGVNKDAPMTGTLPTSTTTISPATENLSKAVTIDGKGTYGFKFASDYSGKITGASTADTITAAGAGVSIAAGAGDDSITVTGGSASINGGKNDDFIKIGGGDNTFYYATGDGDDTITGFQASDQIMTNATAIDIKKSGSNALITIAEGTKNEGTITVLGKGSAISSISIVNSKGTQLNSDYVASSDVLLADDNYRMDAAAITDITDAFSASYTPYDFESGFDLVKKDSVIPVVSYNGDDK